MQFRVEIRDVRPIKILTLRPLLGRGIEGITAASAVRLNEVVFITQRKDG